MLQTTIIFSYHYAYKLTKSQNTSNELIMNKILNYQIKINESDKCKLYIKYAIIIMNSCIIISESEKNIMIKLHNII